MTLVGSLSMLWLEIDELVSGTLAVGAKDLYPGGPPSLTKRTGSDGAGGGILI